MYLAPLVLLDPWTTELRATMRTATGTLTSDAVPILLQAQDESDHFIELRPRPWVGLAPLGVEMSVTTASYPVEVAMDFDGDGTVDFLGPELGSQQFTYALPGLYLPTVTLTFPDGTTQSMTAVVRVYEPSQFDSMLRQRWARMKDALRAGDVDRALESVQFRKRQSYRAMLEGLGPQMANIDAILTDLTFVEQQGTHTEYEMIRLDMEGRRISHLVRFVMDEDGVWRLRFF